MNYLAHGRHALEQPYLLAGTATPDWLAACDRPSRIRERAAAPHHHDADPRLAAFARGIVQHHQDDARFHSNRAFVELSLGFSVRLREILGPGEGHRTSFLGHILVELLLDSELARREPGLLDAYYAVIDGLDAAWIVDTVTRLAPRPPERLGWMLDVFRRERFLYDYADDAKLFVRLNHIMRRVGLPQIPDTLGDFLSSARTEVSGRTEELLQAER